MELVSEFDFILWLVESYSRLHGNLNLWEKQELFSAYAKGEDEFIRALRAVFGTKLNAAIVDASNRTVDFCKDYDVSITSKSSENEIIVNMILVADINKIGQRLSMLADKYFPSIRDVCSTNANLCNNYAKKAQQETTAKLNTFCTNDFPKL